MADCSADQKAVRKDKLKADYLVHLLAVPWDNYSVATKAAPWVAHLVES